MAQEMDKTDETIINTDDLIKAFDSLDLANAIDYVVTSDTDDGKR